jgi:hypothetical protein
MDMLSNVLLAGMIRYKKTVVSNIKKAGTGEHSRSWVKHGKLPWIEYKTNPEIICPCCGAKFVLTK